MRHLDDGELLRYVDGELGPADAGRWEAHVATCGRCRRMVETVQTESRLFSDWMTRADFEADLGPADAEAVLTGAGGATTGTIAGARPAPATAPRVRPPTATTPAATAWLKAAVIVLLVAAPLAAFPGVRSWVVEQVTGGAAVETPSPTPTSSPVVRFEPAPGSFTVRFDAATENGVLVLERTGETEAGEAVLRMDGAGEPVVAERVLRILGAGPGTRLTLSLPATVTAVQVFVGERAIRVGGQELDAGRTVQLDG